VVQGAMYLMRMRTQWKRVLEVNVNIILLRNLMIPLARW